MMVRNSLGTDVCHKPKNRASIIVCVGNGLHGWVPVKEAGVRFSDDDCGDLAGESCRQP